VFFLKFDVVVVVPVSMNCFGALGGICFCSNL
jgi:hypothetical protein